MEQKTYKLTGLLLLFISFILSLVGGGVTGVYSAMTGSQQTQVTSVSQLSEIMTTNDPILSIITFALSMAVLILGIVAVAKLRKQNKRFKLSFVMMILTIIFTILTIVVTTIAFVLGFNGMENEFDPVKFFTIMIVPIAAMLILMIISLFYEWGLLSGCRLVAEDCGDPEYGKKVGKTWRLYLISFILGLIGLVLTGLLGYLVTGRMTAADFLALQNVTSISDLSQFAILLIPIAVFIVAAIIGFIAEIMIIVRYLQTYLKFNGKSPAYVPEIEVSDEIV